MSFSFSFTSSSCPLTTAARLAFKIPPTGIIPFRWLSTRSFTPLSSSITTPSTTSPSACPSPSPSPSPSLSPWTLLVNYDHTDITSPFSPSSVPLYQTATFNQKSGDSFGEYDYTRSGNPTRKALEDQLATIEGAQKSFVFTSGMAALHIVTQLISPTDLIMAGDDMYGGTVRLLSQMLDTPVPSPSTGTSTASTSTSPSITPSPATAPATVAAPAPSRIIWTDVCDLDHVRKTLAQHPQIKLVMIESPTNPAMRVVDIRRIAALVQSHGALLCVDNTMMSPWFQKPLAHGASVVMHSATKFLSGHSDVTAGVLCTNDTNLATRIALLQNATGVALAPFESWLLLRGIKTLAIRMIHQQQSAQVVAQFLLKHPLITSVHYVGVPSHPHYSLHSSQSCGFGSVLSFECRTPEIAKYLVNHVTLFKRAVSFGSVTSTIQIPV